jgi:hypothetical protein
VEYKLLILDSDSLDGFVQAGESADRTVEAIFKQIPFEKRRNFVYWLEQAHKCSKRLLTNGEIAAFRQGVLDEQKMSHYRKPARVVPESETVPANGTAKKKGLAAMFGLE